MNFSQRPSRPAPITTIVYSFNHPIIPFTGWPPGMPGIGLEACTPVKDCIGPGLSPVSKGAEANEYLSENTRGTKGIFPRRPHFWFEASLFPPSDPVLLVVGRCLVPELDTSLEDGRSNTCSVDLSDVTAT